MAAFLRAGLPEIPRLLSENNYIAIPGFFPSPSGESHTTPGFGAGGICVGHIKNNVL